MPHKDPEERAAYLAAWRVKNADRIKEKARAYRAANREEINAKKREGYAANAEEVKAQRRQYRIEHGDEIRAQRRARRAERGEEMREVDRAWHRKNPSKRSEYNRRQYLKDPQKSMAASKAWMKAHPERKRHFARITKLRAFGLEIADWEALLIAQSGRCAICCDPLIEPHTDHDHDTGEVRGLLCRSCNHALGLFFDNVGLIACALEYLLDPSVWTLPPATLELDPTHPGDLERLKKWRNHLWRTYDLGMAQFETMLIAQSGLCLICDGQLRPSRGVRKRVNNGVHVDHDHVTGQVRGILCDYCNKAVGQFKDDPVLLEAAIAYLLRSADRAA